MRMGQREKCAFWAYRTIELESVIDSTRRYPALRRQNNLRNLNRRLNYAYKQLAYWKGETD